MVTVVACITTDHLANIGDRSLVGKEFHYDAMQDWWGWEDELPTILDLPETHTPFKLYDDDDELYYSGWLLNDDWCVVQQFVSKWAEADSGCTRIMVKIDDEWKQEIG